jgi:hypothetical protein
MPKVNPDTLPYPVSPNLKVSLTTLSRDEIIGILSEFGRRQRFDALVVTSPVGSTTAPSTFAASSGQELLVSLSISPTRGGND